MSQAPPEIEALIWSIAESGDARAIAEFETRFPEHRLELLRRVNAVEELRKAKGKAPAQRSVFVPSPVKTPLFRFGKFGLGAIALGGVAFASYWASSHFSGTPSSMPPPGPVVHAVSPPHLDDLDSSPRNDRPRIERSEEGSPIPANPSPIPPTRLPTPAEKPITMHVERANLLTLLDGLAQQAGWDLEVAPGCPDPEVRVDYDEVPPTQILQDMGRRFGFSAFDEGTHKILIVPARDGSGPYKVDPKNQDDPQGAPNPGL